MVDLAGSERQSKTGATGDRLKEATKINLSLRYIWRIDTGRIDWTGRIDLTARIDLIGRIDNGRIDTGRILIMLLIY